MCHCKILNDNEPFPFNDAAGLIRHLAVLMRPWPVVTHVREARHRELSSILPDEYWELDPQSIESGLADIIPAIAPSDPQKLTSSVTFHGAMLTKAVSGQAQVATILHEVHPILGPLTFLFQGPPPSSSQYHKAKTRILRKSRDPSLQGA